MKIENWFLVNKNLVGEVYDHPEFKKGFMIETSPVQSIEIINNVKYANTKSGSKYELGEPSKYAAPEQKDLTLINSIEDIEGMDRQE